MKPVSSEDMFIDNKKQGDLNYKETSRGEEEEHAIYLVVESQHQCALSRLMMSNDN